jgi:hypothetical protein
MPRLALCHQCCTITRLPDPPASAPRIPARWEWTDSASGETQEYVFRNEDGSPVMVAQYDPALEDWYERHDHPHPDHIKIHDLWETDQQTWSTADVVATVRKEISEQTGKAYMERDELRDAAVECFHRHGMPKDSCIDVFSEEKQIGNHESNKNMAPHDRMYLCHLCPFVHGYVMPRIRAEKMERATRVSPPRRRRRR